MFDSSLLLISKTEHQFNTSV